MSATNNKTLDSQSLGCRAFLGAALGTCASRSGSLTKERRDSMSPAQVIEELKKGNQRFRTGKMTPRDYLAEKRAISNDGVSTWRNTRQHKSAGWVSFGTPAVWRHYDNRGHVRMQMTIDNDDPGFGKRHYPGLVFWIVAQVERFCFREREHVMKDWIESRERDARSHGNHD